MASNLSHDFFWLDKDEEWEQCKRCGVKIHWWEQNIPCGVRTRQTWYGPSGNKWTSCVESDQRGNTD